MKQIKSLQILSFTFLLVGCSALQNLTVEDVRQEKFLSVTKTYDLTIKQISHNLYQYNLKCTPVPDLRIDPSNPNKAILTSNSIGFTDVSIVTVVDFQQEGSKTLVKGYKYTTPLISNLDSIIWAIDNPQTCYKVVPIHQQDSSEKTR
jgi:hypothetical protein